MEATIEQVSPVIRKMKLALDAADVKPRYDATVKDLVRTASIPGFRKGKAPARVVQTRYKKDIEGEILRFVAHEKFPEAVKTHTKELGSVIFEEMTRFEVNPDLTVETEFYLESLPEFELKKIENVELDIPRTSQDLETDQEKVLHDLQQQAARLKPIDRMEPAEGDYAEVAITGRIPDGETVMEHESLDLHLTTDGYWSPVVPHILKMKSGEEASFSAEYPDEDRFAALKGKTVEIQARLNQLKERVVPELDDDFARELGQFDTMDALKADIRKNLEEKYQQAKRSTRQRALLDHMLESHEFDVPPSLVQREARQLTESYFRQLAQYGIPMEQDEERIRMVFEQQKPEAERRVRESLLLTKYAEDLDVTASESEVDEVLEKYAAGFGPEANVKTLRKAFEERGELDNIRSMIRQDKTFDQLLSQVTFNETDPAEDKTETGEDSHADSDGD